MAIPIIPAEREMNQELKIGPQSGWMEGWRGGWAWSQGRNSLFLPDKIV